MVSVTATQPAGLRSFPGRSKHKTLDPNEKYMRKLVKAADKLSALIKCIEEKNAGNSEFRTAEESTRKSIDEMTVFYPEVKDFVQEFLPPYGKTLDELSQ